MSKRVMAIVEFDVPEDSTYQQIEAIVYDAYAGTGEPSNPDMVALAAGQPYTLTQVRDGTGWPEHSKFIHYIERTHLGAREP